MDLREVGYDDRDWINLAQDRDRLRAYWPARSPDTSPLDFFLWETVKDSVYQNILTTPNDMQQRFDRLLCPFSQQRAGQSYGLSCNAFEYVEIKQFLSTTVMFVMSAFIMCTRGIHSLAQLPVKLYRYEGAVRCVSMISQALEYPLKGP
ncbi:hypothetical protein ANN_21377 [Periplaneta americana]|uniref:Uncharacterized protein n=1 Tax=Periplaneta americana TaxID=6978 RepID=A0ABQ8SFU8_PERAM|nr:hypothetical protein ANN_21377 [Periplaneta americana]